MSTDKFSQFKGILLLIEGSLLANELMPTLRELLFMQMKFLWRSVKIWLKFNMANSNELNSTL